MPKFLKLLFFVSTLFVLIVAITPFFLDKKKIVTYVEDKVRNEYKIDLTFDKDVNINFIPNPTLNIFSVKYLDKKKKIQVSASKVNITMSWKSIINLIPEVKSLEVFAPVVKFYSDANNLTKNNLRIQVNNSNLFTIEKLKSSLNKFGVIKIKDGVLNFGEDLVKNVDIILKSKEKIELNGNFDFSKLKSRIIFDFVENSSDTFKFIIQQKINQRNKIDYKGKLSISDNNFFVDGKAFSSFLNLDEIFHNINQSFLIENKIRYYVNAPKTRNLINLDFEIEKVNFLKSNFNFTKFNLNFIEDKIYIKNFISNFEKSPISGFLNVNLRKKILNGKLTVKKFHIIKDYFGSTKIDFYDGYADCSADFKLGFESNDFEKLINNLRSSGQCNIGKIKISGVDVSKIANSVDQVDNLKSLIDIINKKNFGKESNLNAIKMVFNTKNGLLNIDSLRAYHDNLRVDSRGSYNILKNNLSLDSKSFFKTNKYKDLPPLGIKVRGPLDDTKISYDFEDLKQKLFNEGVKKILKEKKSIIVDPDTIKKFFGDELKKEFNPKKIIDLFSN